VFFFFTRSEDSWKTEADEINVLSYSEFRFKSFYNFTEYNKCANILANILGGGIIYLPIFRTYILEIDLIL